MDSIWVYAVGMGSGSERFSADRSRLLERLRTQIVDRGGARADRAVVPLGWGAAVGLSRGAIHEWYSAEYAGRFAEPAVALVADITRRARDADRTHTVWIGSSRAVAARAVMDDLSRTLWVQVHATEELVWASDLALRCPSVASVVLDGSGLDMSATRRLQLAAEAGGAVGLVMRPGAELAELSAAATRWLVRAEPSPSCRPRWNVELLRCKGMQPLTDAPRRWVVEWDDAQSTVALPAVSADRSDTTQTQAGRNRFARAQAG